MSRVEFFPPELAIFSTPPNVSSIDKVQWVEYRPISQLTQNAPIEFIIPAAGQQYIDLKKTLLNLKIRLVESSGKEIEDVKMVAPVNLIMHSLFSQVDVLLQQQLVSNSSTQMYAYKAYIEILLDNGMDPKNSQLQSEGYFVDDAGSMEDLDVIDGNNEGLQHRFSLCVKSRICDFEGLLKVDIAQQDRLILNGVEIQFKLWQNNDGFRLLSKEVDNDYKIEIVDASLKVCKVTPPPTLMIAHAQTLTKSDALYPYFRTQIKSFNITAGNYSFHLEDLYQGAIPN